MNFSDFQVRSIRDFRIIFLFRFSLAFDFRFPNSKCLEEPEEDAVVGLSLPELELEVYLLLLMRILPNPFKKNKGILYFKKYFSSVFSAPSNSSPQPVEEEELSTDVEDDEEDEEQGDARRTASVPDGKSADGSDEERRSVHLVDDRATAGTSRSVEAECTTAIELG